MCNCYYNGLTNRLGNGLSIFLGNDLVRLFARRGFGNGWVTVCFVDELVLRVAFRLTISFEHGYVLSYTDTLLVGGSGLITCVGFDRILMFLATVSSFRTRAPWLASFSCKSSFSTMNETIT